MLPECIAGAYVLLVLSTSDTHGGGEYRRAIVLAMITVSQTPECLHVHAY